MSVTMKSAYLPYETKDGARYLTETLWPEGVDSHGLSPYVWVHELAVSYELKEKAAAQRWGVEKFYAAYQLELQEPRCRLWLDRIIKEASVGAVTLLHQSPKKQALVLPVDTLVYYLKKFLDAQLRELNRVPEFSEGADDRKQN